MGIRPLPEVKCRHCGQPVQRVWHKHPEKPTEDGPYWVELEREPGRIRRFWFEIKHGWYRKDNRDDRGHTYEEWCINPHHKALVETFGEPRYWTPVLPGDIPEAPSL